jgi:hypothetical protein
MLERNALNSDTCQSRKSDRLELCFAASQDGNLVALDAASQRLGNPAFQGFLLICGRAASDNLWSGAGEQRSRHAVLFDVSQLLDELWSNLGDAA